MAKSKRAMVQVKVVYRDIEVLKLLFESRAASRDQLLKYIFGNVTTNTVNIRLKKLERIKLIRGFSLTGLPKSQSAYSLTAQGLKLLQQHLPYELHRKCISSDSLVHDLDLIDIRKRLELQNSIDKVLSENVLQCGKDFSDDPKYRQFVNLNSDGVIDIRINKSKVLLALEYDRHGKSKHRYGQKLRDYYARLIDGILYVAKDKRVIANLIEVDTKICKELNRESIFRFATLSDVLASPGSIEFKGPEGQIFTVN